MRLWDSWSWREEAANDEEAEGLVSGDSRSEAWWEETSAQRLTNSASLWTWIVKWREKHIQWCRHQLYTKWNFLKNMIIFVFRDNQIQWSTKLFRWEVILIILLEQKDFKRRLIPSSLKCKFHAKLSPFNVFRDYQYCIEILTSGLEFHSRQGKATFPE